MEMVVARRGVRYEFKFKIDLIVWKYHSSIRLLINCLMFKIDLIVWKYTSY